MKKYLEIIGIILELFIGILALIFFIKSIFYSEELKYIIISGVLMIYGLFSGIIDLYDIKKHS